MAKNGNGGSAKLLGPLKTSGKTNGAYAGPSGVQPKDPLGYLGRKGQTPPSGSPSDRDNSG